MTTTSDPIEKQQIPVPQESETLIIDKLYGELETERKKVIALENKIRVYNVLSGEGFESLYNTEIERFAAVKKCMDRCKTCKEADKCLSCTDTNEKPGADFANPFRCGKNNCAA